MIVKLCFILTTDYHYIAGIYVSMMYLDVRRIICVFYKLNI